VAASDARITWVGDALLPEQGVPPWSDLPLWLPAEVPGPILNSRRAQATVSAAVHRTVRQSGPTKEPATNTATGNCQNKRPSLRWRVTWGAVAQR